MRITGLITEYNPFHNGHQYHISEALKVTGADAAVVVMSGDFVQRGTPALMPKHLRAEIALHCGASAVFELPVVYACASAESFAYGAVSLLDQLNCIDSICFGSECGNTKILTKIANILCQEPLEYSLLLQKYLKQGNSYPSARKQALKDYTGDDEILEVLDSPNNILGIEYIKAILKRKSKMKAYTISRTSTGYHDTSLTSSISSATAIRNYLQETDSTSINTEPIKSALPSYGYQLFQENFNIRFPVWPKDLSLLLKYRLLNETRDSLTAYMDVSKDLANRIINTRNELIEWNQYCDILKTKEITYSRISRALLHIVLDIKEDMSAKVLDKNCTGYARLLAFDSGHSWVLKEMKKNSKILVITKLSAIQNLSPDDQKILEKDIFASDLYESILSTKFNRPFINEYQKKIIKK